MPSVVATNHFLLAISWAIISSLWQGLLIWLLYKAVVWKSNSALFRYNLGLASLVMLFIFFIYNLIGGWNSFSDSSIYPASGGFWTIQAKTFFENFPVLFQLIAISYLIICIINGSLWMGKLFKVIQLKRNEKQLKAPIDYRLFLQKTALHFGINTKVELWMSKNIDSPCVSGYLKPVIFLPFTIFNQLSAEQAEAIIVHELAHIKRNDYLVNLFQSLIDLVLFFNPFAILLSKEIRRERENCCDNWVISYQFDKQLYASALVALEQNRHQEMLLLPAATGEKGWLLHRIKRIFSEAAGTETTIFERFKLVSITSLIFLVLLVVMPVVKKYTVAKTPKKAINEEIFVLTEAKNWSAELPEAAQIDYEVLPKNPVSSMETKTDIKYEKNVKAKTGNSNSTNKAAYTIALVNSELLSEDLEEITKAVRTSDAFETSTIDSSTNNYVIKVEIEQSGPSGGSTAYLFEYNKNQDGKTEVKPLILLRKKSNKNISTARKKPRTDNEASSSRIKITL